MKVGKKLLNNKEFLDEKLKNYKQEKLKCKLPVDTQLLCCAKELKIKERLVEQMDDMDRNAQKTWKECHKIWKKLTQSITDGFALLNQNNVHGLATTSKYVLFPYFSLPILYASLSW